MTKREDEPDLERYNERDKSRDEFSMGPTGEQIERAEKMLGSFNPQTYEEKRNLNQDYRPGSLQPMDKSAKPVAVIVSSQKVPGENRYVVLSEEELPEIFTAEITQRRMGQLHTMVGQFTPSHEGRRNEDERDGTNLMVSFFYPID